MTYQLLNRIKEMWPGFSATEKDFRNPSQEFLMRFYEKFFDECDILDLRRQTPSGVLYPESLNDALPNISTAAFLSHITSHMIGPQVGLDDIIEPIPKKTLRVLENFANYLAYVDCHVGKFSLDAYENASQAVTEKEDLIKEIDDIKEKLNEIALRKAESAAESKKLDNKIFQNAELRDSVRDQCMQIEEELKLQNDALSGEKLEISSLEKEIEKELKEIENLKEKIVSSPDAVTRTIAELSLKKRDIESDQAHLRNRAKQMMLLNTNLEQIASTIQSKLPQVDDLAANLTFLRDLENGLIEDEAAVKSAKEKFDAVAQRRQAIEKDFVHLNQEINHFKDKSIEEEASLKESIQQAHKQKAEAEQKQIEYGAHQVLIAQEIYQLKEEINEIELDERSFYKHFHEVEEDIYNMAKLFMKNLENEAEGILQEE